jgi:type II secretion system protein H
MTSRADKGLGRYDTAGFTLLELLIVLTIMSLLLSLVPYAARGLPALRFRRDVSDLVASLREAHNTALLRGEEISVLVDTTHLMWVGADRVTRSLAPGVERISVLTDQTVSTSQPAIRFLPDGSASPAIIRLDDGARTALISVKWMSGEVRVD